VAAIVTCGNRRLPNTWRVRSARPDHSDRVDNGSVSAGATPRQRSSSARVIGTHSTFPYLESIFPVLSELAKEYRFRLKIVGAGKDEVRIPGLEVENLPWKLEREVADFHRSTSDSIHRRQFYIPANGPPESLV